MFSIGSICCCIPLGLSRGEMHLRVTIAGSPWVDPSRILTGNTLSNRWITALINHDMMLMDDMF